TSVTPDEQPCGRSAASRQADRRCDVIGHLYPWDASMEALHNGELWILMRVAAAMALGGVLGIERELGRHAAGLRTHMLIAGAAALIVGLGDVVAQHFTQEQYRDLLRIDPTRLIESVVAAVGFVGAGAILRARGDQQVRGLTTASSLLMAAAIGIAAGLGNYLLAFGASLMCVVVLAVFRRLENRIGTSTPQAG